MYKALVLKEYISQGPSELTAHMHQRLSVLREECDWVWGYHPGGAGTGGWIPKTHILHLDDQEDSMFSGDGGTENTPTSEYSYQGHTSNSDSSAYGIPHASSDIMDTAFPRNTSSRGKLRKVSLIRIGWRLALRRLPMHTLSFLAILAFFLPLTLILAF